MHQPCDRQQAEEGEAVDGQLTPATERLRRFRHATQVLAAPQELAEPEQHADARRAETVLPPVLLAEVTAHDRCEQRAEVDAGHEQREAGVAAWIVLFVQAPNYRRDIGLEEADAHDDQRQRQVEHPQRGVVARHHAVDHRCGVALDRHARMPGHQQQAAKDHGLAHAQEAVGQQAADDRHAIHQAAVRAQDVQPRAVAELVVLQQVQQQQRLHSVEGEALPHLGEEADVDALGMTEEVIAGVRREWQGGRSRECGQEEPRLQRASMRKVGRV